MKHRFLGILLALTVLLTYAPFALPAASAASGEEIVLYYVPEEIQGRCTLPAGAKTTYQFPEGSSATYESYYERLNVSSSGLVTPNVDMKWSYRFEEYNETISVQKNGVWTNVPFRIINMKTVYPNQVMDNYLKTEIKSTMTTMEKVKKLAEIAQRDFDYINGYPNWQDYIIYGGGTCYASAFFIAEGCTRLGIHAGTRPEKWTAADHRNAAVLIDGKLYAFEAGYMGARPRGYTYWELPEHFSTATTTRSDGSDGVILIRYDLPFAEDDPAVNEVIPVPRTINGLPVTGIGHPSGWYCAIFSFQNTTTINLPDTVEYIYPDAFQGDAALTKFTLPNSVRTIGERAFYGCQGLGRLKIPPKVTTLPSKTFGNCDKLTLTVPTSVTSIADDCFFDTDITLVVERFSYAENYAKSHGIPYQLINNGILRLPAGVKRVVASAFEGIAANGIIVPDGCKSIASKAFAGCSRLKWAEIPASVTFIADDAFGNLKGVTIVAPKGSAAATFAKEHGLTLVDP